MSTQALDDSKVAIQQGARRALSPDVQVELKTRGEIEAYIGGRGKTRVHEGARNLSLTVSDDYGERFLIELIQNAHDAHPAAREDGEIAVVLAPDEEQHGCLYVANRGHGFRPQDFESITNIALSSKPVNESIGNKGLGFRSVLQICGWPEIYSVSQAGPSDSFDGFCFRFATESDLVSILGDMGEKMLATEIWRNMPSWFLPVVAKERPGLVQHFAREGYASVVRMPLDSDAARQAVIRQIQWLLALEVPLHLFLHRVARINFEIQPDEPKWLERKRIKRWKQDDLQIERLKIGENEFLVVGRDANTSDFRDALNQSLAKKQVPAAWKDWRGAARVSVAVRLKHSVERSLLYCFLPLGEEARAPFTGYVNANFYTKLDRRNVDCTISLNRYFITCAAQLCKDAIDFLILQNWPESPGAVVDLLCWSGPFARDMQAAFGPGGREIVTARLLPTTRVTGAVDWQPASETYLWDVPASSCLSVHAIASATGVAILWPHLTDDQRERVEEFFALVEEHFDPTHETIADWVESVAQAMHAREASPEEWAALYDEVAVHLKEKPSALNGKVFLLSATGVLIASQPQEQAASRRRAADIYFPPAGSQEPDDVGYSDADGTSALPLDQMPASLRRGFAFLSASVPWLNDTGGYRPGRTFFLEAKLVREYDTREVLRTLAAITRSTVADSTKQSALEWAFRLWSSGRSLSDKETRAAHFALPTRSGWKASEETMFGLGWATHNGKLLERLLISARDASPDLAEAAHCLLVSYQDWPISVGPEDEWMRFLFATGSRDCLRPVGGEKRIQKDSNGYWMDTALRDAAPDETTRTLWMRRLNPLANGIRNPNTTYRSELHPWRLPAQSASLAFPEPLRREYAYQVLWAIPQLEREHLSFRLYRPGRYGSESNEQRWPTPLMALLTESEWLPVQRSARDCRFVRPADAWLPSLDFEPRPPRFVELVLPAVARASDEALHWLRNNAQLGVLDDNTHAARALLLYSRVAAEGLSDENDVRRFREVFAHAWNAALASSAVPNLDAIPVRSGDRIEALPVLESAEDSDGRGAAFFVDEDDEAKKQLLLELEERVFDFEIEKIEGTWQRLESMAPSRFHRLSARPLQVYVDGRAFDAGSETPLFRDCFGAWICEFIVCAAEFKGGAFFTRTQRTLSRIRHSAELLRFVAGTTIEISIDGRTKALPRAVKGALVLRNPGATVLLVEVPDRLLNLDLLARVAEQLAVALNQKALANGLEAAFLRLAQVHDDAASPPDDQDIARALGVGVDDVIHTRRYARADLSAHLRLAQPLAVYLDLPQIAESLARLSEQEDAGELAVLEALTPVASLLDITPEVLLQRLSIVSDLRELYQGFGLSLSRLNRALRSLGGTFYPISNRELHARQFSAYLADHKFHVIERIRTNFVDAFDATGDLSRYVQLRDAAELIEADEAWFEIHDDLPEEVMEERVHGWLLERGIVGSQRSDCLPALQDCREANIKSLREFAKTYGQVVSAWIRCTTSQVGAGLRNLWLEPESAKLELIQRAQGEGWKDFRLLDHAQIAKWLEYSDSWPRGKPVSTVLQDWGLDESAFAASQNAAERTREEERRARTEISFAGRPVSALKNDYQALMDAVRTSVTHAAELASIEAAFRPLFDVEASSPSGSSSGSGIGSRGRKTPDSSLSEEQKAAVGFLGERWAFEWIQAFHAKRHKKQLTDDCWRSGYRNVVLGGTNGRDDLGYDFLVQLSSTTYYYEVKASVGDSSLFEMGPTEIATALRYRADGDNKYRIIYVAYATDPARVRATVLPNPFSKDGEKKVRAIGRGSVKYAFAVSGSG